MRTRCHIGSGALSALLLFGCERAQMRGATQDVAHVEAPSEDLEPLSQDAASADSSNAVSFPAAPLSAGTVALVSPADPRELIDRDGDGVPEPYDCDDSNSLISPFAVEVYCDGIDQNCDGFDNCDTDNDGVLDKDDCAPSDPAIGVDCESHAANHPGPELK
jgi:hypothetical protein